MEEKCKNKRVDALRGKYTLIGIAKQRCSQKRVDALRGGWTSDWKCKKKRVFYEMAV